MYAIFLLYLCGILLSVYFILNFGGNMLLSGIETISYKYKRCFCRSNVYCGKNILVLSI